MTNDWDDTVAASPGTIEASPGRAYLVVVRGSNVGQIYQIVGPEMTIGRASGVDLQINDEGVSRFHCKIKTEGSGVLVEDLRSRNGTFCNGERIMVGMRPLNEGDRLQIGTTSVLRFTYDETAQTPIPGETEDQGGSRDALTGAYGRRYFVDQLKSEVDYALRNRTPLSLLLLHIDRFGDICAFHGQGFGDQITVDVANHVFNNIREGDMLARFAEGEFALMMSGASPGDTFMLAERLRASSAALTVHTTNGSQKITLSLAVAALNELRIETANDLMIAANRALARARSKNGDCVVLATDDLLREPKDRFKV